MRTLIRVDAAAYFFCALLLLILPLKWFLSAAIAASFHELCHMAAVVLSGGRISCIRIGAYGAQIETQFENSVQELLCSLAGPTGSFFLLIGYKLYPELALCGCIQGVFNLLPIYPMDGGRAIRCIINIFLLKEKAAVYRYVEAFLFIWMFVGFIYAFYIFKLKSIPAAFVFLIIFKTISLKKPLQTE